MRASRTVDKTTGLRSGQSVVLNGPKSSQDYSSVLRRIVYYDAETRSRFVFLTNNLSLPALTITKIYKCRWQVGLFFKWIKQHLRIKAFFGTSENAVKTQIWISICSYILVAIVKKELRLDKSLYEILQILSIAIFENSPILHALIAFYDQTEKQKPYNQFNLFKG